MTEQQLKNLIATIDIEILVCMMSVRGWCDYEEKVESLGEMDLLRREICLTRLRDWESFKQMVEDVQTDKWNE